VGVRPFAPFAVSMGERIVRIDLLYLDQTTCARCRCADRNLESALGVVRDLLDMARVEVEVNRVLVESEEQARAALGHVSHDPGRR
jgi:hypothetical protein